MLRRRWHTSRPPPRQQRERKRFVRRILSIVTALRHVDADSGAATAEFASVLPAVVAVFALLLGSSHAVVVSMRCQDAAATVARELIVAGDDANPQATARAVAGDDVTTQTRIDGNQVTVTVQCPVVPDPFGVLPTRVRGIATGVLS